MLPVLWPIRCCRRLILRSKASGRQDLNATATAYSQKSLVRIS